MHVVRKQFNIPVPKVCLFTFYTQKSEDEDLSLANLL